MLFVNAVPDIRVLIEMLDILLCTQSSATVAHNVSIVARLTYNVAVLQSDCCDNVDVEVTAY